MTRARRLRVGRLSLVVGLVVACADPSAPENAGQPQDLELSTALLQGHVEALAHDSMCGRGASTDHELRAAEYIRAHFQELGLEPAVPEYFQLVPVGFGGLSIQPPPTPICSSAARTHSQNVLAALRGAGPLAGQWVVIGAHYDHLGWAARNGATTIFNGADDNASGTAVVLETARILAEWLAAHPRVATNRRSIMFHAYGAEEIGLIGSTRFTLDPPVPLDSIVGMINLDMVGRLRDETLIVQGTSTASSWLELLRVANRPALRFTFRDDALNRTDVYGFIVRGVPAVHLFTGLHEDYHRETDDPPLVLYQGMGKVGRIALALVWELATRAERL